MRKQQLIEKTKKINLIEHTVFKTLVWNKKGFRSWSSVTYLKTAKSFFNTNMRTILNQRGQERY